MDVRDRITDTSRLESTAVEAPSRPRANSQSATSASTINAAPDSSNVSSAAHMAAQTMQLPEVRQDRVAALQQQIAGGNYNVAPQDVANAMLRDLHG